MKTGYMLNFKLDYVWLIAELILILLIIPGAVWRCVVRNWEDFCIDDLFDLDD